MKILSKTSEDLKVLRKCIDAHKVFGFDYETTSGHPNKDAPLQHDKAIIAGYGVAFLTGEKTYVPLKHFDVNAPLDEAWSLLEHIIETDSHVIWCHNIKFEMLISRASGFELKATFLCSYIGAWLLNMGVPKGGLKLKALARAYLGRDMIKWEDVTSGDRRIHEVPAEDTAEYCADDALQCLKLGEIQTKDMVDQGIWDLFTRLECPFAKVLVHMKEVGFLLDQDLLQELHEEFSLKRDRASIEFYELCGVTVSSPQKVAKRLFYELCWWDPTGLKVGKSGIPSVGAPSREILLGKLDPKTDGYRALTLMNTYSKYAKLTSTYTVKLSHMANQYDDKRLRSDYNQTGTGTGRLSSSNPNGQNIPSRGEGSIIRTAFIADRGWKLCVADYSGADLVMMAHLSRDDKMIKVFTDHRDLHSETAKACSVDRPTGKTCNLGLIYEMSENTLAANLGISRARGTIIYNNWHKTYPGVKKYHERMHAYVDKFKYVKTITGRRRYLPDVDAGGYKSVLAYHSASNTPSQGSVADVIKIAMRNLYNEWLEKKILFDVHTGHGRAKILAQIHDELVVELRDDFAEEGLLDIQQHMEGAVLLRAPLRAEPGLGSNWILAKKDCDVRADIAKEKLNESKNK